MFAVWRGMTAGGVMHRRWIFGGVVLAVLAAAAPAWAQEAQPDPMATLKVAIDTVWVLFTAFLVFWMNAGFACLEAGLCRAKNAVNILAKNFIVFAASSIAFWILGFGLMFGDGSDYGWGMTGWFLGGPDNSPATGDAYSGIFGSLNWTGVPLYAKFFFQLVFAGSAATIVSGAVAERIKFLPFIVFSFILVGVIYPLGGHWIWGGGWLADMGFLDFAGSTVVHSIGGWCALAGVLVLGPRMGKFNKDGSVRPIPGHNMGMATLGTLILWLGWFGFNPGSTMAADASAIATIALNTNMAAAAGCLAATAVAWIALGKPDLSMILNGTLAGLVAITAPCAFVNVGSSVLIGLIAGVLVVYAVLFFDKVKVDDPVGAISVHLVNGAWGTLALGLFATDGGLFFGGGAGKLVTQLIGVAAVGVVTFALAMVAWFVLKVTLGVRVSASEEAEGLDIGEHGMDAYPGFVPTQEARAEVI
ncbi:MAG: ammonium transporter [Acidobacteria bacterium]|nr:ammonium transporter [Acidobacteriota bacterium]